MLVLFGALPPAVLNYIFAERYRQEPERVASIVLIGNSASLAIIPLTLAHGCIACGRLIMSPPGQARRCCVPADAIRPKS
jgi:hypothetical protein